MSKGLHVLDRCCFFSEILGHSYLIGLQKKNPDTCQNAGCDGKLVWSDGTDYTHDGSYVWTDGNDFAQECFIVKTINKLDNWGCDVAMHFLCQIRIQGPPSKYSGVRIYESQICESSAYMAQIHRNKNKSDFSLQICLDM